MNRFSESVAEVVALVSLSGGLRPRDEGPFKSGTSLRRSKLPRTGHRPRAARSDGGSLERGEVRLSRPSYLRQIERILPGEKTGHMQIRDTRGCP